MILKLLALLLLLATIGSGALAEDPTSSSSSSSSNNNDNIKADEFPSTTTTTTTQRWDHNYSCIFETGRTFTYLHIAYVTYFNITYKAPTYCSSQQCLDSCTNDCSCSAVVYDEPTTSCYQYHDYIPVQTIPFIPVRGRDTITAYIKVQHGYGYSGSSPSKLSDSAFWVMAIASFLSWVACEFADFGL